MQLQLHFLCLNSSKNYLILSSYLNLRVADHLNILLYQKSLSSLPSKLSFNWSCTNDMHQPFCVLNQLMEPTNTLITIAVPDDLGKSQHLHLHVHAYTILLEVYLLGQSVG